ncbi:MAG: hypothetical protein LAO31_02585 [Acidobacteriia bacterium]|nr:hypothetical protein [Terriglobia bacterium]
MPIESLDAMPIDFSKVRTYPLARRKSKVTVRDFARVATRPNGISRFLDSLPNILAAKEFRQVVGACHRARKRDRPIIWAIGGHVIKCGLSPLLIHLMNQGYVQHLALNGAGLIHDFEIALAGSTSEDVEASIGSGAFGMARETGEWINAAINRYVVTGSGLAAAVGKGLVEGFGMERKGSSKRLRVARLNLKSEIHNPKSIIRSPKYLQHSLLATAFRLGIPTTIHLAVGTDIIHNHPSTNGRMLGEGAMRDYRTFVSSVASLNKGGVFLNFGSAVLIPEVFLKAVSLIRNQGLPLRDFTTANFDFIQHYRGIQNIVRRPTQNGAGHGYSITGHHELMLPLLAAALVA